MAKVALNIRPREQRLAFIAGGLLSCWGVVSFVVQPLWDRGRELHLRLETQQERLAALKQLLSQAPSIEQQYRRIAPYLQANDEQAQGIFLNELETLSRQSNLRLNLKPHTAKQDERVNRFEIELDVEGSQQNVLAFLDAVLSIPKLIAVERLRIASVPTKEQLLRANLVLQKLSLR